MGSYIIVVVFTYPPDQRSWYVGFLQRFLKPCLFVWILQAGQRCLSENTGHLHRTSGFHVVLALVGSTLLFDDSAPYWLCRKHIKTQMPLVVSPSCRFGRSQMVWRQLLSDCGGRDVWARWIESFGNRLQNLDVQSRRRPLRTAGLPKS